jgi:hypothetical protein
VSNSFSDHDRRATRPLELEHPKREVGTGAFKAEQGVYAHRWVVCPLPVHDGETDELQSVERLQYLLYRKDSLAVVLHSRLTDRCSEKKQPTWCNHPCRFPCGPLAQAQQKSRHLLHRYSYRTTRLNLVQEQRNDRSP